LAILLLLLLPACNSAPDSLEPRVEAPKDPKDGWYSRLFLTDKVFGDSFRCACPLFALGHLLSWFSMLLIHFFSQLTPNTF